MNQEEQINELNAQIKVKLAPSKISGIGVFAIMDIRKGERLNLIPRVRNNMHEIQWYNVPWGSMNKLFPEIKELILERWPSIVNGSHFISPNNMAWLITYVNHSNNPNYEVAMDMATCDIKKGEEILENYKLMTNWNLVYPDLLNWK